MFTTKKECLRHPLFKKLNEKEDQEIMQPDTMHQMVLMKVITEVVLFFLQNQKSARKESDNTVFDCNSLFGLGSFCDFSILT